jgi:hypothetical protein
LNDVTHSWKNMKRRERRLREPINRDVREALQGLSERGQVFRTAQSLDEIEKARKVQRASGLVLKAFENTNARRKDLRNQRLRTERAWTKIGAAERSFVKTHVTDMERKRAELERVRDTDMDKEEGENTGQDAETGKDEQQGNTRVVFLIMVNVMAM